MKPIKYILGVSVPYLIIIAGCASRDERQAFKRYRALERSTYGENIAHSSKRTDLPDLNEKSTLSDYLAYAALNNPGLRAAFNSWKADLERILPARTLPDPRFTYGYYIQQVETRTGPQRHRFGISQAFPWYGKLKARSDMELEAANAAEKLYENEKLKLFYRVKDAYYEHYHLARAIAIAKENMDLLTYLEQVARTRYKAGAASYSDVIKAQVELGKLDDRLRTLEDLEEPIVAKLNAALNRPIQAPLPRPKNIPEEQIDATDEELIAWLKRANPELKALAFEIEKEKDAISLAKQEFIPDISLGFEWIETGTGSSSASDRGKDPLVAIASINLPIWYQKYKAQEREARARFLMAQNTLIERENTLLYDVQLALYNFRDAGRKIDLYRDTLIPKGEQSLKATDTAYQAGKLDFLTLIDAQRVLLEFQLSYERALANHAQRLAELEKLVGAEIPREGPGSEEGRPERTVYQPEDTETADKPDPDPDSTKTEENRDE